MNASGLIPNVVRRGSTVAIDARIVPDGRSGGAQQFIEGLVQGLGTLGDRERYLLVVHPGYEDWLSPFIGPNQTVVPLSDASYLRELRTRDGTVDPPFWEPDQFFGRLDVDVVHFTTQQFVPTVRRSIYCPHDLQHLHLPDMFDAEVVEAREHSYRAACAAASAVVMPSQWARQDILERYALPSKKVYSIKHGGLRAVAEPDEASTLEIVESGSTFAIFPSQTWPHKNHIRLLEAVALLRDRFDLTVKLVCPGKKNDHWSKIQAIRAELDLEDQVLFPGFVTDAEMAVLWRSAQFLVYPSLFEGGGIPLAEALTAGIPAAVSRLPSLEEYGGEAVLYFDPGSVEEIARSLRRMMTDPELRRSLVDRGAVQAQQISWERSARAFRALYRSLAGRLLGSRDRAHLAHARKSFPGLIAAGGV